MQFQSEATDNHSKALQSLLAKSPSQWAALTPLETIEFEAFNRARIKVSIKREDLLHEFASGNKLYKLWGHLMAAQDLKAQRLVSFGGYYSNHLHALAHAGKALGVATKAMVRGHRPKHLSPTLADCQSLGMQLQFVSRKDYLSLKTQCLSAPPLDSAGDYWVPEGGGASAGISGCSAIIKGVREQLQQSLGASNAPLTICAAVGTGTMASGLLSALTPKDSLLGYCALKFGDGLASTVEEIRHRSGNLTSGFCLFDETNFGGFARVSDELFDFMADFHHQTGVLLDPLYTGKMLYRIVEQAAQTRWQPGEHLIVVHSGGLQGRRGFHQLNTASDI